MARHPLSFIAANDPAAVTSDGGAEGAAADVHADLAALGRKHYRWYYSTASANTDMTSPSTPGGLPEFLRGYFHTSTSRAGSWVRNDPHPLRGRTAAELAQLPNHCICWRPSPSTWPRSPPLTSDFPTPGCPMRILAVYVSEHTSDLDTVAGKKIVVPGAFVSGKRDWGTYQEHQEPGAVETMADGTRSARIWVPQEKPEEVAQTNLELLRGLPVMK
ncbi:hypothetical protein VTN02DRAFT_1330 [Thermoascus thermophilus]